MKAGLLRLTFQSALLLGLAGLSMGNKGCKQKQPTEPEARELRRRAQMGEITAPQATMPGGGTFDFKFAANAQMYQALKETKSFSTSLSSLFDPKNLSEKDKDSFYSCEDDRDNEYQSMSMMGNQKGVFTQKSACMINVPNVRVKGAVINFQLTSASGIGLDIPSWYNFGTNVEIRKATLTMSFQAEHPVIPDHYLAASTSRANHKEVSLSAKIGLGGFGISPKYYFQSDLAKVVADAMSAGLTDLKEQMDINDQSDDSSLWYTYVVKNCDKAVVINAGGVGDAGLMKGDLLEVYNVWYDWDDNACVPTSHLKNAMRATSPSRVIKVVSVGDTMSIGEVVEDFGGPLNPGARVYVKKLIDPKAINTEGAALAKK